MSYSNSSSSSRVSPRASDGKMPYRRRGQKIPGIEHLEQDLKERERKLSLLSSGQSSITELQTVVSAYEEVVDRDTDSTVIPQRTFEVGPGVEPLPGRKNAFIRTGVVGMTGRKRAYRPSDEASTILMKPGVGSAMRREDTRYGQNLSSALTNRGLITNKRVLVLGSGCASSMTNFFSRGPSSVLCIDSDEDKVDTLRRIVYDMNAESYVSVVCGDATDPSCYANSGEVFDLILVTKSFGSILTGFAGTSSQLLSRWMELIATDGVIAIDTQTMGHERSPNGKVSGVFDGEDKNIASVWGRYDDDFYDLEELASGTGMMVRERINLSVRGSCGKQGEPLLDSMAQMWVMYLISTAPRTLNPVVPSKAEHLDKRVNLTTDIVSIAGGCDLLPPAANGSKLVPWRGVGDSVTREYVYPKFDGMPGQLYYADGQLTFVGKKLTVCKSAIMSRDEYAFLAEACTAKSLDGTECLLLVILGVMSINGVYYDANDLKTLEAERSRFEKDLLRFGVIVTSPTLMLSLRQDAVRIPSCVDGEKTEVDIPVDGINVSVGGSYGNFLKPRPLCTLDITRNQKEDLKEAVSMALLDEWQFQIEWADDDDVWEYGLEGELFRPIRKRIDKSRGATVVRLSQDLSACAMAAVVFTRANNTWELYNDLVSKLTTYRGTRAERQGFFL